MVVISKCLHVYNGSASVRQNRTFLIPNEIVVDTFASGFISAFLDTFLERFCCNSLDCLRPLSAVALNFVEQAGICVVGIIVGTRADRFVVDSLLLDQGRLLLLLKRLLTGYFCQRYCGIGVYINCLSRDKRTSGILQNKEYAEAEQPKGIKRPVYAGCKSHGDHTDVYTVE